MKLIGLLVCLLIMQTSTAQFRIKIRPPRLPLRDSASIKSYEKKVVFDKVTRTAPEYDANTFMIIKAQATQQEQKNSLELDQSILAQKALQKDEEREGKGLVEDDMEQYLQDQAKYPARKRYVGPSQFDSRIELRDLNPLINNENQIISNARSVGLIILKENLQAVTDSFYRINTSLTLGSKYGLCIGQAFATQPVAGEGTAFLIKGDGPQIMTANHVFTEPVDHYAIVFGYEVLNKTGGAYETFIPITDIYYLTQILYKDEQLDVAVAALNKPTDRPPLTFSTSAPAKEQDVYMIGYPCGLPAKVAMNAGVKENNHPQYFYTSLDAFQGNSGSPVFNMNTHEIIGILVSGEVDFVWNGSCNTVTSCRIPYCKGEKAIRIKTISDYITSQTPPGGSLLSRRP
ncbi:trypsin-like serine protease [Chitinophaga sp. SYP-B3965]|uniref:trypsin-like serine peptidase n=1 Tax=Chitinophaga sp. SYP-B3965 TaxID=2663120 RepID=UPI0012999B12|nr:serine protease [Chitinophaga sp. SYP-B3965]MRG46125.1 trypsin-like serine protease [Chitinophaga sp. SYP-B3965]